MTQTFRVSVRDVAAVIHGVHFRDTDWPLDVFGAEELRVGLFGAEPVQSWADIARPILAAAFPFLNQWIGRTHSDHLKWIAQVIAEHGPTVQLQPLARAWYLPDLFPNDVQIEEIIKAIKQRRFYINRPFADSGPVENAALYGAIRHAMQQTAKKL